jgi:lipopolysaccharide export system protein LptA
MTDGGEDRTIAGQELAVQLELSPAGERFARFIRATGGVRTKQGGDEMQAGQLDAELAPAPPATQPVATVDASDAKAAPANPFGGGNAQLVSLVAGGGVKLATKDGSAASADSLEVVSANGKPQYRHSGTPAATVTQGKTVISGPAILFAPDEQLAKIDGAGGMKGTLPDDPKEWFDIAWAGGAVVNGATNLIDVTRQVVIRSVQKDGTINTATSSRLQAKLGPKPTTQPIAATRKSQSDEMNFLAGKEITAATLLADAGQRVEIKSELFAPDGALLRGVNLYADTVKTNRATGRLEIPVPGEMIVRDHRPPDGKKPDAPAPAPAPAAPQQKPEGPTLGSGRGNTAFRWNESLVYDDAQRQAVMTGNVKVIHHPITKDGQPFNLWADTLTAQLEPNSTAAAAAAAAANANQPPPPNQPAGQQPRMRVKRVTAVGNVRVESTRLDIEAREISYDPVAQVLHARGTPNTPITVIDKETGTPTTAGELEWNTATDQFRVKDLAGKVQP